VKVPTEKFT